MRLHEFQSITCPELPGYMPASRRSQYLGLRALEAQTLGLVSCLSCGSFRLTEHSIISSQFTWAIAFS